MLLLPLFYAPVWISLAAQQIAIVALVLGSASCAGAMSLGWLRSAPLVLSFALVDYWMVTRRGRSLTQYPVTLFTAVFLIYLVFAVARLFGLFDIGASCIADMLLAENSKAQLFIYEMILSASTALLAVALMQTIRRRLTRMGYIKRQ